MSTFTFIVLHKDREEKHNVDIYLDDTIENIKTKLSEKLEVKNIQHYYMFYKSKIIYNPYETYKSLSLDGNRTVTSLQYDIFCMNHGLPLSDEKDRIYELDDFLKMEFGEIETSIPIGISRKTAFVVNPFKNKYNQIEDSSTTSKELLMNLDDIDGKEIYVCLASEVFDYCDEQKLETKQVINVYYPYLFQQDQIEKSALNPSESSIPKYKDYNEMIDFLHSKYNPDLKPTQGISDIYFVIYSLQPIDFPVHVFFKLIQTSLKNPFIKLNGKRKSEHMYRLFCNKISDKGNNVPYMSRKELVKFGEPLKKPNNLCYFFQDKNLFMEIDETGNIFIKMQDMQLNTMEEVEKIVKETSTEIIDKLLEYFDPSNKIFSHFKSFKDKNIDIIEITYKFLYKKEKRLDIKKYMSCFSCVFNYIDDLNDIVKLRYKRVSDFNVSESMDAFLIEAVNKQIIGNITAEGDESVRSLIYTFAANFKNNDIDAASKYVNEFFRNIQLNQEVGRNRLRKVKTNPGFLIEIRSIDKNYEVKVNSVNDIKYIPFIEMFLSNLLLMSQGIISDDGKCFKKVTDVAVEEITVKTTLDDIVEDADFDIVMEKDEDLFDFDSESSEEEDNETPLEEIKEVALNETPLEEVSPDEVALNETPKEEINEVSLNETPKEEELDEMSPNEVALDETSKELAEMSPNETPNDEDSPLQEMSPNEMLGGAFEYSSKPTHVVFMYDNHDPATMIKEYRSNKDEKLNLDKEMKVFEMKEARLNDYFRAFDDNECSIVSGPNTGVKGYSMKLTSEQFRNFIEKSNGYEPVEVDIYDKAGNIAHGVSYKKTIEPMYNEPGLTYLKHLYATVEFGWKKKYMDEPGIIYIYDKKYDMKGKFNGDKYIKKDEEIKLDLDSKNPFLKRMQERQPILFPKEDADGKMTQYSRLCQWTNRRHPVILTKEEKDEIDELAPGAYDSVLEYSTDPKKPYYYICPRYWDLKHMRPVKPEDVDKSKLIPGDASGKEIKANIQSKYILEFSHKGEFHPRIGFLTKQKTKDGYYLPCCFKQSDKKDNVVGRVTQNALESYKESKKKFEESMKEKTIEEVAETKPAPTKLVILKRPETVKYTDNILNGDKFPLDEHRKGHLTPILERFFDFKYSQCYSNIQKKKLKLNQPCLLRRGVEHSNNQSFLAAMAFVLNSKHKTIDEFKTQILNVINIDNIQSFHGGNIVHTFSKPDYDKQDISNYTNSKLYKSFRGNETAFKKIVNGYENFKKYLLSDEYIDYTYLWDILCSGLLYKTRINLVILHEDMQDPTHNLTIVCPTTTHSDYRFNPTLPSCILYRYGNYFEPIFSYSETEREYSELKFFNVNTQIPTLAKILKQIDNHIGEMCREKNVSKKYVFKMNLYLDKLIEEVNKLDGYTIEKQIMNFDGRIIGIMVTKDLKTFFVPCRASQVSGEYELIHDKLWNNYNTTVTCLGALHKDSKGSIPCRPKMKMIEDSMIIGVLTETNQMIPLMEPEENTKEDGLPDVNEHNYVVYDQYISEHPLKDEKAKAIKNLKLEQSFYNAFFNTIKVKVNDLENLPLKMNIQGIIKGSEPFDEKLEKIKNLLSPMIETYFDFIEYDQKILDEIDDINLCKTKDQSYCSFESDEGKLLIPVKNLFSRLNNQELYMNRFVDDLISNFFIQDKFFHEVHSTIYYTDKFNLSKNEILLLENAIRYYYDENSTIVKNIPSIQHRTMEDVQPNEISEILETIPAESPEPVIQEAIVSITQAVKPLAPDDILEEEYSSEEEETELPKLKPKPLSVIPEEETVIPKDENQIKTIPKEVEEVKKTIKEVTRLVIVAPPKKKKTAEVVEAKEKISAAVEKAQEILKKEDSPKHRELLAETKEVFEQVKKIEEEKPTAPPKIQLKIIPSKKLHETLVDPQWKECISDVAYLTDKWKQYFKKGTKDFRIGIGKTYHAKEHDLKCNMYMALNILKDYNPEIYRDHKIADLKAMLVKMYQDYISYRQFILMKWKMEKERDYALTKESKIEDIIMSDTYEFTEVDMVLMTFYYNIPIVFFHQGKDKIKMLRRENHTEDYSYYIKMKGTSIFMLFWQHTKTFKIYDTDLIAENKKDLFETRMSLKDYLENSDFYHV